MWIATTRGFISAVQDRFNVNTIVIRARCKQDIDAFASLIPCMPPEHGTGTDYPWRIRVTREEFAKALAYLALKELSYPNFKDAVAKVSTKHAHAYHDVWETLLGLEDRAPADGKVRR